MDNDDRQVGRILRRREVLALLGGAGGVAVLARSGILGGASLGVAGAAAGVAPATALAQTPTCIVQPELTEGPFFVDGQLNRSDIRVEVGDGAIMEGVPLTLAFNVSQVQSGSCVALPGAQVDIWQCDALGRYSGVNDSSAAQNSVDKNFLRGHQLTDDNGLAQFTTVYPGWYRGRTVHIHFKVRTTATTGDAYEFTSQLFFPDELTDVVYTQAPYSSRGTRDTRNARDGIYQQGGAQLLLTPAQTADGYAATFAMGLDLSDLQVGASDRAGGMGGPGGGRGGPSGFGAPPPRR